MDIMKYYERGCNLLENGRKNEAKEIFETILQQDRSHFPSLNKLGVITAQSGEYAQAREYFQAALAVCPDYGPALVNMGNLHQEQGDFDGAELWYQRAMEMDEDYPMVYYNLALLYKCKGNFHGYIHNIKKYKRLYGRHINDVQQQHILSCRRQMGNAYYWATMIFLLVFGAALWWLLS